MTTRETTATDDNVDAHVDDEIIACLSIDQPKSFFLFAGAGSGKTRSLVHGLNGLRANSGKQMRLHGQQVAVITFTNAACDEIKRRLDFDPLVIVSTIHSFVWDLIQGFNADIRSWLQTNLKIEIDELGEQQRKGRAGSQAALDRTRSIEAAQERLASLSTVKRFIYSPNGDNRSRDSLNHSEVIKIGAAFISSKPLMQTILVTRFPIVLIDESQDTNRLLMEALLDLQAKNKLRFALGLFGDTMQRIYSDGKIDLGKDLPDDWGRPAKVMNHRSPRRIIRLINKIRSSVDGQEQRFTIKAKEGCVRFFVSISGAGNKREIEEQARRRMAEVTGDTKWNSPEAVKTLTLEHHMAAKRMDFFAMYEPLYRIDAFKTGLRDGSLPMLRFFSELLLPLVKAQQSQDDFAAMAVVRRASPLLSKLSLQSAGSDQLVRLRAVRDAVDSVMHLFDGGAQPRFIDVLRVARSTKLFEIPDSLLPFAGAEVGTPGIAIQNVAGELEGEASKTLESIRNFLGTPFEQITSYAAYVNGKSPFATQQGVKGLEFPRVMVIIDDEDAGGFLFSYEKLFGAKSKTTVDLRNEQTGNETGIDRTRRLFYVTCSRSQESLAIVAYSSDASRVKEFTLSQGWFDEGEIEFLK